MSMTTRRLHGLTALAALFVAAAAGCQPKGVTGARGDELPAPADSVPLDELARRLAMAVRHTSPTSATLCDGANTVVLYCDPDGEVYVNGEAMPDSGGIVSHPGGGGTLPEAEEELLVPVALVSRIRSVLRPLDAGPRPEPAVASVSRRPPANGPIGCVVIDPGHGGRDPGAISVLGSYEKHIVLAVSRLVAEELQSSGVKVLLTRSSDTFVELEDRPAVANRCKADLFASIHADAAPNRSTKGFTLYVSRSADAASLAAANAILRSMDATGTQSKGVRRADYRVLVHSTRPAVLIEVGYLTNRWEAQQLSTESHQNRIAHAIARGVLDFLNRQ